MTVTVVVGNPKPASRILPSGVALALAPDLLLKPVLVEPGATTALPGPYLSDRTFGADGVLTGHAERRRREAQALSTVSPAKQEVES
ncbi:hypothetical protein [Nocardia flavorosea]|uniref:Uncharacterized protein n=1 Tax=Nocardia flavorosea TaxID=53429 RepID=A0A846YRS5_9NOCA|nr:hypothetical protein [Nocardia flavorosea]NKY60194.1 hypothetical protein [Nocardia flavorosea]